MVKKCKCDSCEHKGLCKYEEHFRFAYDKILDTDISMSSKSIIYIKDAPFVRDVDIHCKYRIPTSVKEINNRGDVFK